MDLEKEYNQLIESFGEENLKIEYFNPDESEIQQLEPDELISTMFCKIKITHLSSKKVVFGTKYLNQMQNSIIAMQELKLILNKT